MPHSYLGLASLKSSITVTDAVDDARLRSVLEAVAEAIDGADGCYRTFQPYTATRYYRSWDGSVLRLDEDLIEVTSLKTDDDGDGTYENTWATPTDYFLEPANAAIRRQPYGEIVTANYAGRYSFSGVQRGVQIVGIWGYWRDLLAVDTVKAGGWSSSATSVEITGTGTVEALQTLLVDDEQIYVTGVTTGANDTLAVERGANGTTAAAHSAAAAVSVYRYPAAIVEAARLSAAKLFQDVHSPYGVTGGGDLGTVIVPRVFDPRVRAFLQPYRRILVAA